MAFLETLWHDAQRKDNKMQYETANEEIKKHLPDYAQACLAKSKSKNQYNCPFCGSGTGPKGTGAFTIYPEDNRYKCFACGVSGDIFDLAMQIEGADSIGKAFRILSERYGIKADRKNYTVRKSSTAADYTRLYEKAHGNIDNTDYHRGLSRETLDRFMVGFIPDWQPPGNPDAPKTPRLIIPRSTTSYLARDTRRDVPEYQKPYTKQNSPGKMSLFNMRALSQSEKPVYVVEGEFDAMSICDVGGEAIATCSTSNIHSFLQALKNAISEQAAVMPLIIAFDDDEAGQKATAELVKGLQELHKEYCIYKPHTGYKDANEALNADRKVFQSYVLHGMEHINELTTAEANRETTWQQAL